MFVEIKIDIRYIYFDNNFNCFFIDMKINYVRFFAILNTKTNDKCVHVFNNMQNNFLFWIIKLIFREIFLIERTFIFDNNYLNNQNIVDWNFTWIKIKCQNNSFRYSIFHFFMKINDFSNFRRIKIFFILIIANNNKTLKIFEYKNYENLIAIYRNFIKLKLTFDKWKKLFNEINKFFEINIRLNFLNYIDETIKCRKSY